jgi:hypothetical protein
MATIEKQFTVPVAPNHIWNVFRDLGAVHTRLARQFVVDTRLDGDSRLVTFANGTVVRERFVTIDERRRRLVYSVTEWLLTHHNGSFEVLAEGNTSSRIVWVADLLPDHLAGLVEGFMDQGVAAMQKTLLTADRVDR